ncbi:MAG: hypothetical protein D6800_12030 [Candidatus Zixiibacteriota bacterium]|nr:MAG: hypothetical protein D6800_12030 [candidate division Zixibacteria bacterium]
MYEKESGVLRRFELEPTRSEFPDTSILLDSLAVQPWTAHIQLSRSANVVSADDSAWAEVELIAPYSDSNQWSGVLTSAPLLLTFDGFSHGMEPFSFLAPRRLFLAEGPRLSYDSTKLDTITVMSHQRYVRVGITQIPANLMRSLAASVIAAKADSDGNTQLPILPTLESTGSIPGTELFVDSEATITVLTELHEAEQPPEFHIGVHFHSRHNLLWRKKYRLTVSFKEFRTMTPPPDAGVDVRTCLVPSQLTISNKRLVFSRNRTVPYEFRVGKGSTLGYAVQVNGRRVECRAGYPQSPLTTLRKHISCNNPVDVTLSILSGRVPATAGSDRSVCDYARSLWFGHATITSDSGTFDVTPVKGAVINTRSGRRWRECRVPKKLIMKADGSIVFDSTAWTFVDFFTWSNQLPLFRLTLDNQSPRLLSTFLVNPLARWHPGKQADSVTNVRLDLVSIDTTRVPTPEKAQSFWSHSYELTPPQMDTVKRTAGE